MLASASRRQGLLAVARWATGKSVQNNAVPSLFLTRGAISSFQDAFVMVTHGKYHTTNNSSSNTYQQPVQMGSIRYFAAAPSPESKGDEEEGIVRRIFHQVLTPRNQFYALVAGGTIGAYGISRVFLAFTNFFTHLTPTVVAKWGFYTGFGCATGK